MVTRCQQGLVSAVGTSTAALDLVDTMVLQNTCLERHLVFPKMSQKGEVVNRAQPGSAQGSLTQSLQGLGSLLT